MYIDGYTCQEIADNLTAMQRKTKRGNTEWSVASILEILQNERHCGDVLARKTFTPNYLNHKSKKNNKDRPQYRQRDHHEAIISRDDFIFVQHLIANNRAGGKGGYLPELHVITTGYFAGYVPVNTRWAAFTHQDYLTACRAVPVEEESEEIEVTVQSGDLDLRGFEVVREQLFSPSKATLALTVRQMSMVFSQECLEKLGNCSHVEFLLQPEKKILVVRQAPEDGRNGLRWCHHSGENMHPQIIRRTPFLKVLYGLCNWRPEFRYRIRGMVRSDGEAAALFFPLSDTEVFVPPGMEKEGEEILNPLTEPRTGEMIAVPQHIAASFGSNFYYQAQAEELAQIRAANMNKTMVTMVVETEHDLHELEITRKEDRDSVIAEYEKGAEEHDE